MPPHIYAAGYEDVAQGLAEWQLYNDRVNWATQESTHEAPVDGG